MNTNVTNTILKSPKCKFNITNDYKSVIATKNIISGDILLIEHCQYSDNQVVLMTSLRFQEELFNELYPRKTKWIENYATNTSDEIQELINNKIQHNCFGDKNEITIGNDISWFNHNNEYNAYVHSLKLSLHKFPTDTVILSVVATKNIYPGEEIFIKYNDEITFENNTINLNNTICTLENDLNKHYNENERDHRNTIIVIVKEYTKKEKFSIITGNQIANHYGLYMSNDLVSPTPRFIEYIKSTYHIDPTTNINICADWLEKIYLSIGNIDFS